MKKVFSFENFFCPALSYVSESYLDNFKYNKPGIYIIKNKITGDCYVGQSVNVKRRLREHKRLLRNNKHKYRNGELTILQKAWNKYGEENFIFDYLEHCNKDTLDEREIFWINQLQCNRKISGKGYNVCGGGSGQGHVEDAHKNLKGTIIVNNGDIQKYINPKDLEFYESIGYTRGLAKKNIEKLKSTNRCIKRGPDHHNFNKTWSKESREKFNNTIKNRKNKPSDKRRPVVQEDILGNDINKYISITEASGITGISQSSIVNCCKGKRHTAGGFKWKYEEV